MLKNKIYKYLASEIFKNFITILFTFTAIAWTVRAVNFLDLIIDDGYSAIVYFKYSLLNISNIISRFVPLSFLLSLIISITKFERQQELLILWVAGLNKIKIANIFFLIGFCIALLQILLGLIINPFALNKSRTLLRETSSKQISSILKSNDFSDNFQGITFYIDEKNSNNELINIFIKDNNGSLKTIISETNKDQDTTIYAKKGYVLKNKLILFNGTFQTLTKGNKIKNINFEKTELSLANFSTRTIMQPKIQETSSFVLFKCVLFKNTNKLSQDCIFRDNRKIVVEALSRRLGMPLYIPLISIIASYLLVLKKEKKYNYLRKYIIFFLAFVLLVSAEILLKFTGFSSINFALYFLSPIILLVSLHFLLTRIMMSEKIAK